MPGDLDSDEVKIQLIRQCSPSVERKLYDSGLYERRQGQTESAADFRRDVKQLPIKVTSHKESPNFNSRSWLDDIDLTSSLLSESEKSSLIILIIEYHYIFVTSDSDLSKRHRFSNKVNNGEYDPFRKRPYTIP